MRRLDWLFQRIPQWMQVALNTQQTNMPQSLVTVEDDGGGGTFAPVQSIVDVFQGGVGVSELVPIFLQQTGPILPAAAKIILQGKSGVSYLLLALNIDTNAIAAARRLWFGLLPITNFSGAVNGTGSVLFDPTLPIPTNPADAVISWKTINGTADGRVYIPEGTSLAWSAPDLGAGESVALVGFALKIPAGFKPF